MSKKIAIIGSGAIGAFYGARLLKSGQDVHFLFHSDFEYVDKNGLKVNSVDGDMYFDHVNAYKDTHDMPICDIVVIAMKATQNHLLYDILSPICNEGTTIILLQNGLNGEEFIHKMGFGSKIFGGLCFVCCNKLGPGYILHQEGGRIIIGQYDPEHKPAGISPDLKLVADIFEQAEIEIERSPDLILARWHKLLWNIPFNGLCALLKSTTDLIMGNQASRKLALDVMREVQAGAAAQGRDIPDSILQKIIDFTDNMKPYKPSMMLDAENKREMELEAIYGEPIKSALSKDIIMSKTEALYLALQFLNDNLK